MKVGLCQSILLICLCGCSTYKPRPIDPVATKASFENARLTDPAVLIELTRHDLNTNGPIQNWDLDRLFLAALVLNPEIKAARADAEVFQAAIKTASARLNPTLSLLPEYATPAPPWILGFSVDIPIETAGKRANRISHAESAARAAQLGLADAMWRLRSRLRNGLIDYFSSKLESQSVAAEAQARTDLLRFVEKKLANGEASVFEVETARTEQLSSQLNLQASRNRMAENRAALAQTIGVTTNALAEIEIGWPDFEKPPELELNRAGELLNDAPLSRADVQQLLAEYDAAEAALKLEVSKQYPDIHFAPGYAWDQHTHKIAFGGSFALPILDQNQGPIAEADAKRTAAEARFVALQSKVINDAGLALLHYDGALESMRNSELTWKNIVTRQAQVSRRAFELGELDRTSLYTVQIQSAVFDRNRLAAIRDVQLALGMIEDAAQKPLSTIRTDPTNEK
jgi:cobalt-zinc-cadmium efflux system outer membrane protein